MKWVRSDLRYARRRVVGYVAIAAVLAFSSWVLNAAPDLLGSIVELGEWQDPAWP